MQEIGQVEGLLHSSSTRSNYLLDLLKVLLKTAQGDHSKIIIILDDLDGLRPSELSDLSEMISGDHIEVIYSTRDPMISDQTSYMYAANFDVPPLEPRDAQDLFRQLRKPHLGLKRPRENPSSSVDLRLVLPETKIYRSLFTNVGYLPAAIFYASHYLDDCFTPANLDALTAFLENWEGSEGSEAARGEALQFRRRAFIYPHMMQASFDVSSNQLRRNLENENAGLYACSLHLLRLLSIMGVNQFARSDLNSLCALLGQIDDSEKAQNKFLRHLSGDTRISH